MFAKSTAFEESKDLIRSDGREEGRLAAVESTVRKLINSAPQVVMHPIAICRSIPGTFANRPPSKNRKISYDQMGTRKAGSPPVESTVRKLIKFSPQVVMYPIAICRSIPGTLANRPPSKNRKISYDQMGTKKAGSPPVESTVRKLINSAPRW